MGGGVGVVGNTDNIVTSQIKAVKTSGQSKSESDRIAEKFYNDLYKQLRRLDPLEYVPIASRKLFLALDNVYEFPRWPPHFLLHSIEADLTYFRPPYKDRTVVENDLRHVMNMYHNNSGKLPCALINEVPIDSFLQGMAWEQFYVQKQYGLDSLGRYLFLFVSESPFSKTEQFFQKKYEMTFHDWFVLTIALFSFVLDRLGKGKSPILKASVITNSTLASIPKQYAEMFFSMSSKPRAWFAERFKQKQQEVGKPSLYPMIRSSFLEYPILDFGRKGFLVPHPYFLLRQAWSGLYRLSKAYPTFPEEMGTSFEKYVRRILNELGDRITLYCPDVVSAMVKDKSVDFIVEFSDCILLVECKAVEYTAQLVTPNAIENNNFTAKIIDAYLQMNDTVHSLRQRGKGANLSIYGIIVTLGDFDFPNSDWFRSMIEKRLGEKCPPIDIEWHVMPISVFQEFVGSIKLFGESPKDLFEEKRNASYVEVGDWDTFLYRRAGERTKELATILETPIKASEEFFNEIQPCVIPKIE